jgi:hypothetical protein
MMAIPTKDGARNIFGPFHGLIWRVIHEAFAEWREVQAFRASKGFGPMLYDRSIANYVFDAIARRAILIFGAEDRMTVKTEAQTFKVCVGGLVARMKKGDEDNLGSSAPTQAALAFESAEASLPGFPPETAKVEIVWRPNDIGTAVERILVVGRDGDRLMWEYEITDPAEGEKVVQFPTPPSLPSPPAPSEDDGLIAPKARPLTKPAKPNE